LSFTKEIFQAINALAEITISEKDREAVIRNLVEAFLHRFNEKYHPLS
jgi:hypothetical protein